MHLIVVIQNAFVDKLSELFLLFVMMTSLELVFPDEIRLVDLLRRILHIDLD